MELCEGERYGRYHPGVTIVHEERDCPLCKAIAAKDEAIETRDEQERRADDLQAKLEEKLEAAEG